jgi:ferredoxin-NADP reductase
MTLSAPPSTTAVPPSDPAGTDATDPGATSADPFATRPLLVTAVCWQADGVITIEFRDPAGGTLPEWRPGAHIELVLPSGLIRQYSLCGDPGDRTRYTVAVLREADGRGGSRELHDTALVGRTLPTRGPRNHFELTPAPSYLFLAGGIGITPIRAMVRHADRSGATWSMHYGGRTRGHMAFADELQAYGPQVHLVPQDTDGLLDLAGIVAATPDDVVVYACGPEGMLRAVEEVCAAATPPRKLRIERFAAASSATPVLPDADEAGEAFEVELSRSGVTISVPPDRTILDAVRDVLPEAPSSCEEGFCGTCETRVLAGRPDHRDQILSEEEREESETMMICVSRSCSPKLVLNL